MALKRTKLLDIQSISGINTVGIFTVGITDCTGPVGVASTTYLRGVMMHNTGLNTCTSSLFVYPAGVARPEATGYGVSAYRLSRVSLAQNETYYFEPNYPIVLVDRESLVVEVSASSVAGTGIGSMVNFQLLGDTDVN
tara:strand:- start:1139 stop:1552 length:414 start_codon:yes stop_codon:yes gene_type:complete